MLTDQIADMFTRIRNAVGAKKRTVTIPASRIKKDITKILFENHFVTKYAFVDDGKQGVIKILLKYDEKMENAIQGIQRTSTPGLRRYSEVGKIPKVLSGMGIAIISTSKGVLTDKECRNQNVGGEVLGKVW
jgi:small subunit ribosomal protein S8